MNRNSGHRPYPFLAAPVRDLFDRSLRSTVNNGSVCASSPNLNYRVCTRSLSTFNSYLNAGVHIVAGFRLCEP